MKSFYNVLLSFILILVLGTTTFAQENRYSVGIFLNRNVPIFRFQDRYDASHIYGIVLDYQMRSRLSLEFEYHRAKLDRGKVEHILTRRCGCL